MSTEPTFPLEDFRVIGKALVDHGLLSVRGGNMSIRFPNGRTVITRHNSMNAFLEAADFAEIAPDGTVLGPEPSSDTPVHLAIYRVKGPGAIIHAHPRYAIALSLLQDRIVPVNLEGRHYLTDVPVVQGGMASGLRNLWPRRSRNAASVWWPGMVATLSGKIYGRLSNG